VQENIVFYCFSCNKLTKWNYNTLLAKTSLNMTKLEFLINLFVENFTIREAFNFINSKFISQSLSEKTIAKYFKLFSQIALHYYDEFHASTLLEGEIEIDETQMFKPKKSSAPSRSYVAKSIWLVGFKERNSGRFLIFPTRQRTEAIFIPLLLKHVKVQSKIYSDCFSIYVNNKKFLTESKLEQYGFIHQFINHKISFVNPIFTHIHTNTVERLWKTIKDHINSFAGGSKIKISCP